MAIWRLALGLALLLLVLFVLVLLATARRKKRRRSAPHVTASGKPSRCAWCERQIDALDEIRVEMGVSYTRVASTDGTGCSAKMSADGVGWVNGS